MYHISVKNIFGVQKAPGGGKKAMRGHQKIMWTFLFFIFIFFLHFFKFFRHSRFCGGAPNQQGAPNGNVTPLKVLMNVLEYIDIVIQVLNLSDTSQC